MKIIKYTLLVIIGCMLLNACKEDKFELYLDTNRLQFGPTPFYLYWPDWQLADTLKLYTFAYEPEEVIQDTVFFDLYTIGNTTDYDRPFRLEQEQVAGAENAVSDVHYKAFDHAELRQEYVMKAGEAHMEVPIVLLRDPSLKDKMVVLKLKLVGNEHFQEGIPTHIWRKIEFTDRLSRPQAWDDWVAQYYLGKYSIRKHQFMIDETGQLWNQEFVAEVGQNSAALGYWRSVFRNKLLDWNNSHDDVLREDENDPTSDPILFP